MDLRKDLIMIKLKEIEESRDLIQNNLPDKPGKLNDIGLIKDGIYKRTEYCIENMLDICAILNADYKLGIPEDEDDIIKKLADAGLITKNLSAKIREMKGFRNLLVHRYGKMDDLWAYKDIKKGIKDFEIFQTEIRKILEKS
jgi:uncharacterized protein YutE (UPF0331/DUF86 family)